MLYETLMFAVVQFHHANVALPARVEAVVNKVIVTPAMHKVHHSRWQPETDSNYSAMLSVWDRLFRSFRRRDDLRAVRLGLDAFDDDGHQSIAGMLRTPARPGRPAGRQDVSGPRADGEPDAAGGSWRAAWASPPVRRARRIAYWAVVVGARGPRRATLRAGLPPAGPRPGAAPRTRRRRSASRCAWATSPGRSSWSTCGRRGARRASSRRRGFVDLSREFAGDVQFVGVSANEAPDVVAAFAETHAVRLPDAGGAESCGRAVAGGRLADGRM